MVSPTVDKDELIALGFKPHQAKTILHEARQIMVRRGNKFWANPRLSVAPRAIIEDVVLGFPLSDRGDSNDGN